MIKKIYDIWTSLQSNTQKGGEKEGEAFLQAVKQMNWEKAENLLTNKWPAIIQDEYGRTAWHYSVLGHQKRLLALLVDYGVGYYFADNKRELPLHYAARSGDVASLQILLKYQDKYRKAFPINDQGQDLLHIAVQRGDEKIVEFLVHYMKEKSISINCLDKIGRTPLEVCREIANKTVEKILIEAKEEVSGVSDPLQLSM